MFYFLADKLRTNGGFHYNLATKPVETYSKKIFREVHHLAPKRALCLT